MKKFMILALMAFMLVGCGNQNNNTEETTATVDMPFEEISDTESEDDPAEESTDELTVSVEAQEENKTQEDTFKPSPEVSKPSPVENVSNSVFVDVSAAVRNNCNSTASANTAQLKSNLSSMAKTDEEKLYVNTALNLINSYTRLNNCRKIIYDNNDVITDEDIALLTEIEDGLGANVEIFLNTNTTSIMTDDDFDYTNELNELELSVHNKTS